MSKVNEKNRLDLVCPELAKQWHPTKNGNLTPSDVSYGSKKKVWWQMEYYDEQLKKTFLFEWRSQIYNRYSGKGCPFIDGNQVWVGYNDLATRAPHLIKEWHPTKNGSLTPLDVSCGSDKKVWWQMEYYDEQLKKTFLFEWKHRINKRYYGEGCPFIAGKDIWVGYNDLATRAPQLVKEWHPTKNKEKTPFNVTYGSAYYAWWILYYTDPVSGKTFCFEWQARVYHRLRGEGCPFLVGKKVYPGFNDLATKAPDLALQVHPIKSPKASTIFAYSNKPIWWLYPYDDPKTGKHFEFEWQASPSSRLRNPGCPFLSSQRLWPGFNDFQTLYPELAKEWCWGKNDKGPDEYMPNSRHEVWWQYPYDDPSSGNHYDFVWKAKITNRVQDKGGCPFLSGNALWEGFNDLKSQRPELAAEWAYEKNHLKPEEVMAYSDRKRWWKCPKCGKNWYASPAKRARGQNCKCNNDKEMMKWHTKIGQL